MWRKHLKRARVLVSARDVTQLHNWYHIKNILIALMGLMIAGTLGYHLIEGWSLFESFYMVVITVATVGYGEVHPLSTMGKLFNIFVILNGVGIVTYSVSLTASYLMDGKLQKSVSRKMTLKKLKKMKDHFILIGLGTIGEQIAKELTIENIPFIIVDKNEELYDLSRASGWIIHFGDASNPKVLEEAGIKNARGMIISTSEDTENVFIALAARTLHPDLMIVSRAESNGAANRLTQAGVSKVIMPHKIAGAHMATVAISPSVVDFLDIMLDCTRDELRAEEFEVTSTCNAKGKKLGSLLSNDETPVSCLLHIKKDGTQSVNPRADAKLDEGDKLILFGSREDLVDAADCLQRVHKESVLKKMARKR